MSDPSKNITKEDIRAVLGAPIIKTLEANGITPESLALELKEELTSGETKTLKIKGKVEQKDLPSGVRILTRAIIPKLQKEGEDYVAYDDGDTVIQWDEVNWATRQKARQDAHRLMGHYPPEKSGDSYVALILQQNNLVLSPVVKQIIDNHTKALAEFIKKEDVVDVEVK